MRFIDVFIWTLIPLFAGLLLVAVSAIRRKSTYSPVLALGMILIGSTVAILGTMLILSALSMVFHVFNWLKGG